MALARGISLRIIVLIYRPLAAGVRTQILLVTDRFSRRTAMYVVSASDFTVSGIANFSVNGYVLTWDCLTLLLTKRGTGRCSEFSRDDREFL